MAKESDAGLLLFIGAAGQCADEQQIAREALRELHFRHYSYLLGIFEKYAANAGTVIIDPSEFALATLKKAFRSAYQFTDRSGGDPVLAALQVRAWLGVIGERLAKDELRRLSRREKTVRLVTLDETHDAPEETQDEDLAPSTPTNPEALVALQEQLGELKPEERDILMTYAAFGIVTPSGRELPADVREDLETRTGYERSTIRKKWQRLTERLETQLKPFINNTKLKSPCQTKIQSTPAMK